MKKWAILLSWLLVAAAILLIFSLSDQPAKESNALSKNLSTILIRAVHLVLPEAELPVWRVNRFLRQAAHFGIYLILGLALDNGLRVSGMEGRKRILMAILFCAIYATGDELFQPTVPGRGTELGDVLTDSAGAVMGVLICEKVWEIFFYLKQMERNNT